MNLYQRQIFGTKKGLPPQTIFTIDISDPSCYLSGETTMNDLATGKVLSLVNGPIYSDKGLLFDGVNDYAIGTSYASYNANVETTIELFFKLPTVAFGYREIFSCQGNDTGVTGFHIQRNGTTLQFTVGGSFDFTLLNGLVANNKYFLTLTISGSLLKFYLNGIFQTSITITAISYLQINRYLFANTQNSRWCNMILFYARVSNQKLLTPTEITANYNLISSKFL